MTASQLEQAKKELSNTIHEGLLRIRNKLPQTRATLKRFNPYQPTFKGSQASNQFDDKSLPKNVDEINDYSRHHLSFAGRGASESAKIGLDNNTKHTENTEKPAMRAEAMSP